MSPIEAISRDDLIFVQLACKKLAGMIKGLTSVGIGCCYGDRPTAKQFILERSEDLKSLAVSLRCIGANGDFLYQVKDQAIRIHTLLDRFQKNFLTLADRGDLSPDEVRTAGEGVADTYAELCQALQDFAGLIELEANFTKDKDLARIMVDELVFGLRKDQKSLAGA